MKLVALCGANNPKWVYYMQMEAMPMSYQEPFLLDSLFINQPLKLTMSHESSVEVQSGDPLHPMVSAVSFNCTAHLIYLPFRL